MKRSSLAWYVAVACLGGSLCVGPVDRRTLRRR